MQDEADGQRQVPVGRKALPQTITSVGTHWPSQSSNPVVRLMTFLVTHVHYVPFYTCTVCVHRQTARSGCGGRGCHLQAGHSGLLVAGQV